jgi:hypothetical protein
MPKANIPVFDYRAGKHGDLVDDKKIHGVRKIDIYGNKMDGTPYMGDNGLHGGVVNLGKNGKKQIVYH